MGRTCSTYRDPDEVAEEAEPESSQSAGNAYWRVCERCGKVLSGPHTTAASIRDAMMLSTVCEGGCEEDVEA